MEGNQYRIFDEIRRKRVVLTPEEWVRQNFTRYLIDYKKYPAGLISFEKSLSYGKLDKRADILVHNREGQGVLMVECKAPGVKVNQSVFDQVAGYNHVLKLSYIIATNGMEHFCFKISHENNSFQFLEEIPAFADL